MKAKRQNLVTRAINNFVDFVRPVTPAILFLVGIYLMLWVVHGARGAEQEAPPRTTQGGSTTQPLLVAVDGRTFFCGDGLTWDWAGQAGKVVFRTCTRVGLPFADGFE